MAVRFDASADALTRNTGLWDYNATYTWMAWVYVVSKSGANYQNVMIRHGGGSQGDQLYINNAGNWALYCANGGASDVAGSSPSTGTWYHVAVVRSSTTALVLYIDGAADITNTLNVSGRSDATPKFELGNNAYSEWCDMRMEHVKLFTAALTVAEIQQEMRTAHPHRAAWGWWTLRPNERTTDWSGNGRDLTAAGTLTDESGPPVSWGVRPWVVPFVVAGGSNVDGSVTLATNLATANSGLLIAGAGLTLASGMGYSDGGQWAGGGAVNLPTALAITDSGLLTAVVALALSSTLSVSDGANLVAGGTVNLPALLVVQDAAQLVAQASAALAAQLATAQSAGLVAGATVQLPAAFTVALSGALGPSTYEATLTLAQLQSVAAASAWLANAGLQLSARYSIQPTAGSVVDGSLVLPGTFGLSQSGTLSGVAAVQLAAALATAMQSQADANVTLTLPAAIGLATGGTLAMFSSIAMQLAAGIVAAGSAFSGSLVTPDGRIVRITLEARVVTVDGESRVIVVPAEDRSIEA